MEDDQQFCLRWNNHQSTLVSVFDTLLESGTLVDCTLAAEGKYLNAHKVVLSACSPYFESLLSKHYDKHPILILKDVKFQELKAMMDYMYRGEVNISQDQLGALLKAAESLQIKGLSDNRKGGDVKPAAPIQPKSPQPASTIPKVQGLTIEQRTRDDSREGSQSPGPRKKKRIRRKSEDLDNHDVHSNSSESHSNHGPTAQNIPLPAPSKLAADVPEPLETKSEIILRHKPSDEMIPQVPIKEKIETHTELMLEPKSEYVEEMNEDSIEDLTLDDDDMSNMEHMGDGAGPSHGNMGEGSSQGFGSWHLGNQSQDEVFLAAQEAVGAHRDSQDFQKIVLQSLSKIAATLKRNSTKLDEINHRILSSSNELVPPENLPQNFPMNTLELFQSFERLLWEDADVWHYMVKRLAALGGSGGESLTRRILKFLITDEVASLFNWKGRDKMPFEKLKVTELVVAAVRVNYATEMNELKICNTVKDWLKFAKVRMRSAGRKTHFALKF
ncbi:longitudinals lacking protein, isoforms A/B/D/L isoform X5 [Coccinella septempunctata]|uniref:longitudinals lacking protein, isoforms A/B/D/L isoform X5 n=1 Tax=Coccinella septempunctata TaxID=41139 RepID=UPI001D06487B|nr:longitudinals lacking protein, isoforms A/B/D/L isoform X5 [Coccinella septempunctata]